MDVRTAAIVVGRTQRSTSGRGPPAERNRRTTNPHPRKFLRPCEAALRTHPELRAFRPSHNGPRASPIARLARIRPISRGNRRMAGKGDSVKTIYYALGANFAIFVAK